MAKKTKKKTKKQTKKKAEGMMAFDEKPSRPKPGKLPC